MNFSHVVAASTNGCIGKNGKLLWHLPNDMRFFKDTTWGSVVIMGRKTFESVGKALPGRINIVISRQPDWFAMNVHRAESMAEAVEFAKTFNCLEIFVIGGAQIYDLSLPYTKRIYLTRIHTDLPGDTFYPSPSKDEWRLLKNHDFSPDEKHAYGYSFQIWDRVSAFKINHRQAL